MSFKTSVARLAIATAAITLTATSWAASAPVPVADDAPDVEVEASQKSIAMFGEDLSVTQPADSTSLTDDHSLAVPTGWYSYVNVSAAQVNSYLSQNHARLTEIEISSVTNGVPRFTVRMVANSGAYAVSGWAWYFGQTFAQVGTLLTQNNARLVSLTPYDNGGGVIRYAVVMVANTGAAARGWTYLTSASVAQVANLLSAQNQRLIDLHSYVEGGVTKYAVVAVTNSGADNKAWQWFVGQSPASVSSKLSAFGGRLVKLNRNPNGTYNFIQVKNAGSDSFAWWYAYGFTNGTDLGNYAAQVAARPVDIGTYLDSANVRRYDAVFIDNANVSTQRMRAQFGKTFLDANGNQTRGIFEAYLKQVGGNVKVDLNSGRAAEVASSLKSLHLLQAMKEIEAKASVTLSSSLTFYLDPNQPVDDPSTPNFDENSQGCPDAANETVFNRRTTTFNFGLGRMMSISDNRMARAVVLRYGFDALNTTANVSGMVNTELRQNIGCAYRNVATGKYDPVHFRNDTTAADLAHLYEGVWNSTLLSETHGARTAYLNLANPGTGAGSRLQAIINQEAAALGKSAIAAQFGQLVQGYGKGGSYGTFLPKADGSAGQAVIVRSGTGIIRLPIKVHGTTQYRTYVQGALISDVPVACFEDFSTPQTTCPSDTTYTNAWNLASTEIYRDEVRLALQTW